MRRSRARRWRGEAIIALEVGPALIAGLVALGWLSEDDKVDKGAIARALTQLAERALWANVTPAAGSQGQVCFACDLRDSSIHTLIDIGWLPTEHARRVSIAINQRGGFEMEGSSGKSLSYIVGGSSGMGLATRACWLPMAAPSSLSHASRTNWLHARVSFKLAAEAKSKRLLRISTMSER
jgi:hypothetical protein